MIGTHSPTKTLHVVCRKTKFFGDKRSKGFSSRFLSKDDASQRLADLPPLPGALGTLLTELNAPSRDLRTARERHIQQRTCHLHKDTPGRQTER